MTSFRLGANVPAPDGMTWLPISTSASTTPTAARRSASPKATSMSVRRAIPPIGSEFQYGLVDLGFAGVGFIPSWDVPGAVAKYMTFNPVENLPYLIPKAWTVEEKHHHGLRARQYRYLLGFGAGARQHRRAGAARRPVFDSEYFDGTQPAGQEIEPIEEARSTPMCCRA